MQNIFSEPANPRVPDHGAQTNNTISYASRATKPAFSAYASNPSHVATSYAVPNLELSLLFVTKQSPLTANKHVTR